MSMEVMKRGGDDAVRRRLRVTLGKPMSPFVLSYRKGPGGLMVQYVSGADSTRQANEVFGPGGWCTEVRRTEILHRSKDGKKYVAQVVATVRVTLSERLGGTYHENIGVCKSEDPSELMALEHAMKGAATDATKRALAMFGDATGNCLRDKQYADWAKRMVAGTAQKRTYSEEETVGWTPREHARKRVAFLPPPTPPALPHSVAQTKDEFDDIDDIDWDEVGNDLDD